MDLLTKRQYTIYMIIKEFVENNGYSPSIRELCDLAGLRSPATMHVHLKALCTKGYITYKNGANRTIRIIKDV